MYNRILKRPMFKRGGSSFQAQGTGITSPYDTPRKKYNLGSWGEWEQKTRDITKDPRGDWSYAAQGFSSLGNPYKESGGAKTIGEMLWEGAQGVRGSKEKASELERKGELAILESQGGRMLSEEERAFKAEEAAKDRAMKLQVAKEKGSYPDMHPGKLYDWYLNKWRTDLKNNTQAPGIYTQPGWSVVEKNIGSFANADLQIRTIFNEFGPDHIAAAVPPIAFKEDGTIDVSLLRGDRVYYDPIDKEWFTVKNAGTETSSVVVVDSYLDGQHNISTVTSIIEEEKKDDDEASKKVPNKLIITTNLKDIELTDAVVMDEAAKVGIKIVFKPADGSTNWKVNLAENEMSLIDFKEILKRKKFTDTHEHLRSKKKKRGDVLTEEIQVSEAMAHGGRAGYASGAVVLPEPDKDVTELEELNAWWKSQVNNATWNKEITDEG
jgi:hypothetical protein